MASIATIQTRRGPVHGIRRWCFTESNGFSYYAGYTSDRRGFARTSVISLLETRHLSAARVVFGKFKTLRTYKQGLLQPELPVAV